MADAPARAPRSNLPKILAALAAVAAVVVILFVTGVIGGGDDDDAADAPKPPSNAEVVRELREGSILAGPRQAPFAMRYTNDWAPLSADQLAEAGDVAPIAGLRRKDRSGVLTITLRGPVRGGIGSLEERLPAELARRFDDFKLQTIRRIDVAAGPALYTSWTRTKVARIQTQLVVPVSNRRSFTVDVVLNANATDAAAEAGAMLRTFDTAPAR
jgi:hypothetical protein